jgi:flagellar basal-body rod modification protein FlgD
MPVDPLSYLRANDTPPSADQPALDKNAFLRLLTTQLQYQDPSNPESSAEFVAQLATFANVEKLTSIDSSLGAIYSGIVAQNAASMSSLLGTSVVARGNEFHTRSEGPVDLTVSVPSDCTSANLVVMNESGTVVATEPIGALLSGENTITWSGKGLDGSFAPPGEYTYRLDGFDAQGSFVDIEERVAGVIDAMDYSTGTPIPSIYGTQIPLEDIIRLTAATP